MSEENRDDRLLDELGEALRPREREPDPERVRALRAAVADSRSVDDARASAPPRTGWRERGPRPAWALAAALLVVALIAAVVVFADDSSEDPDGVVEYAGEIALGPNSGELRVVEVGIGRTVELETDDLEILPKGEFYELWFVGPGDSEADPNRISAGTFHPDSEGRSDVTLTAAVDPSLYPIVSVTAEPGDGDPEPTGPEVLRTEIE